MHSSLIQLKSAISVLITFVVKFQSMYRVYESSKIPHYQTLPTQVEDGLRFLDGHITVIGKSTGHYAAN